MNTNTDITDLNNESITNNNNKSISQNSSEKLLKRTSNISKNIKKVKLDKIEQRMLGLSRKELLLRKRDYFMRNRNIINYEEASDEEEEPIQRFNIDPNIDIVQEDLSLIANNSLPEIPPIGNTQEFLESEKRKELIARIAAKEKLIATALSKTTFPILDKIDYSEAFLNQVVNNEEFELLSVDMIVTANLYKIILLVNNLALDYHFYDVIDELKIIPNVNFSEFKNEDLNFEPVQIVYKSYDLPQEIIVENQEKFSNLIKSTRQILATLESQSLNVEELKNYEKNFNEYITSQKQNDEYYSREVTILYNELDKLDEKIQILEKNQNSSQKLNELLDLYTNSKLQIKELEDQINQLNKYENIISTIIPNENPKSSNFFDSLRNKVGDLISGQNLKNLQSQLAYSNSTITQLKDFINNLNQRVVDLLNEKSKYKDNIKNKQKKIDELYNEIVRNTKKIETLENSKKSIQKAFKKEINNLKDRLEEQNLKVKNLEHQIQEKNLLISENEKNLYKSQKDVEILAKKLSQYRTNFNFNLLDSLNKKIHELQNELRSTRDNNNILEDSIQNLVEKNTRYIQINENLQEKIKLLNFEIEKLNNRIP